MGGKTATSGFLSLKQHQLASWYADLRGKLQRDMGILLCLITSDVWFHFSIGVCAFVRAHVAELYNASVATRYTLCTQAGLSSMSAYTVAIPWSR